MSGLIKANCLDIVTLWPNQLDSVETFPRFSSLRGGSLGRTWLHSLMSPYLFLQMHTTETNSSQLLGRKFVPPSLQQAQCHKLCWLKCFLNKQAEIHSFLLWKATYNQLHQGRFMPALKYSFLIIKADRILTIWTTVLCQNHYCNAASAYLQPSFLYSSKDHICGKSACLHDSEEVLVSINLGHSPILVTSIQKVTVRYWYLSRYLLLAHIKTQDRESLPLLRTVW